MTKLIIIFAVFYMFGCMAENEHVESQIKYQDVIFGGGSNTSDSDRVLPRDLIWSQSPANEWADGYPIGNGRIGAMVLGGTKHERIALNHDLLWRQFWSYQKHNTATDLAAIRAYCSNGQWDEAEKLVLKKIPSSGRAVYVNPFIPVGDLFIDLRTGKNEIKGYTRKLNMDEGIVTISYDVGDFKIKREVFCSWKYGVMAIHITANKSGVLSGELSLSRIPDPDCTVSGYSELDKVVMEGEFEEGRRFASVAKIFQRGGRLSAGRKMYKQVVEDIPKKDFGIHYVFSKNELYEKRNGASTFFDSADEVIILLAITIDEESNDDSDLIKICKEKLKRVNVEYSDMRKDHIINHRELYRRVSLNLESESPGLPTDQLLKNSIDKDMIHPALLEKFFNLSRYLSIASGRSQQQGQPDKAPINLQGIWNQDRRPAWDSDYHLDLNLEMCYWPLNMLNLGDQMIPLMDWAERMIPEGRKVAKDLYGCDGVAFSIVADNTNMGNVDNIGFYWTGGAAWIAQLLWQHWEYTYDEVYLQKRLYPFMLEIFKFYDDFLIENDDGFLLPSLSTSPEMSITGRELSPTYLSSASTMDLELIRDLYTHLIEAGKVLNESQETITKWQTVLDKLALPRIGPDGALAEWIEEHIPGDPGHRHRAHLVGLCPGDRISVEKTPDYAAAAYKALKKRHQYGNNMSASFTYVWDAQMLARLFRGDEAYQQLIRLIQIHALDNLLLTTNDWRGERGGLAWFKGIKLFQAEASPVMAAAISEMLFQDRQGLLRFLPALPQEFSDGQIKGLRARGGFEVDLNWGRNRLISAKIRSISGQKCRIKNQEHYKKLTIMSQGISLEYELEKDNTVISFDTDKGQEYQIIVSSKRDLSGDQ